MKYKMLIFDLDNTIFDFTKAEDFALQKTFSDLDIPLTDALLDSYYKINAKLWNDFEKGEVRIEELKGLRFSELTMTNSIAINPEIISKLFIKNLGKTNFVYSGAHKMLKYLRKSFSLATITNGIASVQRSRLRITGLDEIFQHIIISEEEGVAKPNPIIFEKLLKRAKHKDRSTVLMIGDGLNSDIAGAKNTGIDSCWYNPRRKSFAKNKPDYIASNFEEIIKIVFHRSN